MKKYLLAFAILVGSAAASQAAYICNLDTDHVNVRSGPSARDYPIVDQVSNFHNVVITGSTINAAGFRWVNVRYNSGRRGFPSVESGWVDAGNVCN